MLEVAGQVRSDGYLTNSDRRLKTSITELSPETELSRVLRLQGIHYFWKDSERSSKKQLGYIAQEVEEIYPELVSTDKNDLKSVNYSHLIASVTDAIKALFYRIQGHEDRIGSIEDELRSENAQLKTDVRELKERLEKLEALVLER